MSYQVDLFTCLWAVQALQVMYTALNSPTKLTNWKTDGGDPCGESWKGVTCQGSAVVSVYESVYFKCSYLFLEICSLISLCFG